MQHIFWPRPECHEQIPARYIDMGLSCRDGGYTPKLHFDETMNDPWIWGFWHTIKKMMNNRWIWCPSFGPRQCHVPRKQGPPNVNMVDTLCVMVWLFLLDIAFGSMLRVGMTIADDIPDCAVSGPYPEFSTSRNCLLEAFVKSNAKST